MDADDGVGRRTALGFLAAAASSVLAVSLPAMPGSALAADLLEIPALKSAKASKVMLLAICRAGDRLVAVGEYGVIVHSDDGARTWRQASVPVSVALTAVHFPTPRDGWAVGHDGVILHSADGGATWTRQFDGRRGDPMMVASVEARLERVRAEGDKAAVQEVEYALDDARAAAESGPSRPLLGVWFANADDGFAVGSYGQLFRTRDGGREWNFVGDRVANPEGLHYNAIIGVSSGALLIAGEGGRVYRSADGGESWETLETGAITALFGVREFVDAAGARVLLAFGFGGKIFRRVGDGDWVLVASPARRTLIAGVDTSEGLLLVDNADGRILTRDAGASFTVIKPPSIGGVVGATITSDGRLVEVGLGGVRVAQPAA